jgi:hypothetical protein
MLEGRRQQPHIQKMERADHKINAKALLRKQRAKRLTSEIYLLEQMDWRLWKLGLTCFWATFAAVVGGTFATVTVLGQPNEVSNLTIFLFSLFGVGLLYWMWRYPIWSAALLGYLVIALFLAAIFDDVPQGAFPDLGFPSEGGDSTSPDKKEILRQRVQRAIEKRQKLILKLNA